MCGSMFSMKKKYVVLKFIPMLLIMIAIFYFSSQHAEESTQLSDSVINTISESKLSTLLYKLSGGNPGLATLLVRKGAHFSEYALLGWFALYAIKAIVTRKWAACIFAESLVIFYAISDEIHQFFVPGRSSSPVDVCIDAAGALAGIWLFMLGAIVTDYIRIKVNNKKSLKK